MPTLLIFDCDGVLVDSELLEHAVDAELLGPFGYSASAAQLLRCFVGIARRDMCEVVFGELKRGMPHGLLEERERRVWARCENDLERVPGVAPALDALKDAPECVASSSLPAKLQMKLASNRAADFCVPVVRFDG